MPGNKPSPGPDEHFFISPLGVAIFTGHLGIVKLLTDNEMRPPKSDAISSLVECWNLEQQVKVDEKSVTMNFGGLPSLFTGGRKFPSSSGQETRRLGILQHWLAEGRHYLVDSNYLCLRFEDEVIAACPHTEHRAILPKRFGPSFFALCRLTLEDFDLIMCLIRHGAGWAPWTDKRLGIREQAITEDLTLSPETGELSPSNGSFAGHAAPLLVKWTRKKLEKYWHSSNMCLIA